jgi:hypothetical protein
VIAQQSIKECHDPALHPGSFAHPVGKFFNCELYIYPQGFPLETEMYWCPVIHELTRQSCERFF